MALRRFVIERDIPKVGSFEREQLREAAAKSNEVLHGLGPDIQWVESYVADDKTFCVYLASRPGARSPPPRSRCCCRPPAGALFFMAQSGRQWRMLPKDFPPYTTVQQYFQLPSLRIVFSRDPTDLLDDVVVAGGVANCAFAEAAAAAFALVRRASDRQGCRPRQNR